jgi:mRNA interferase MazF
VIQRGGIHWIDFGPPAGSRPARRRPSVVVQSDHFNRTGLGTIIVAALTTNLQLSRLPGNVFVPAGTAGLTRDSVVNVTSVASVGRDELDEAVGVLPLDLMKDVDAGLRLVLGV